MQEVTGLDGQGNGIAGAERIAGALPGDAVDGASLIERSPHRQVPPCAHFGTCGGCALQHATDGFLASWKVDRVRGALSASGLDAPVALIHASPPRSRRRVVLSGRRTRKTVQLGFYGRASDRIVDVSDCHLVLPQIQNGMAALRSVVRLAASRSSTVRISVTAASTGLDVAVDNAREMTADIAAALPEAAAGFARLTWNGAPALQAAAPAQLFGATAVVPPPAGFLQATADGEAAMVAWVTEALAGARAIMDLFCGCGTFTLPLAATAEVCGWDGDTAAIAALDLGWRHGTGLRQVRATARDLFRRPVLAAEMSDFDAAVLDPPRPGADAQVSELAAAGPPRIAYVSCNPTSFARDARALCDAGYVLGPVAVIDQFRWSTHVELAALLTRR